MRTQPPARRTVHVMAATCVFALTALSLAACKGRSDEAATDTSAGAVTFADTAVPGAATTPAQPTAAKPAAAKPTSAPAAKPKTYPPFDPSASAKTVGVIVYPKQGQTIEQQHFDENECFAWAKTTTGIDLNAPAAPAAAAPVAQGGAVRGAARGAAAGVAIGAIAGDAGKGAAIGATAGAMAGRRGQKTTNAAAANDAQQQAAAAEAQRKKTFADAFSACMSGRNYSAK